MKSNAYAYPKGDDSAASTVHAAAPFVFLLTPMVQVHFTAHLRHIAPESPVEAKGATIRAVLDDVFSRHAGLKTYILDDQDRLRTHIAVFLDNEHIRGAGTLEHGVKPDSELYILQALSGGRAGTDTDMLGGF